MKAIFRLTVCIFPMTFACGNQPPPGPATVPTASTSMAAIPDAAPSADPVAAVDAGPPPEPETPVTVLAKNQHASAALTADGAHRYRVQDVQGTVTRVPKRGGAIMMFYSSSAGGFASPSTIAIDDKEVYWTE